MLCSVVTEEQLIDRRHSISMMIPTELLPIISAHLSRAEADSPVIFEVPPPFQLHRLISAPSTRFPSVRPPLELHPAPLALRVTPQSSHPQRPTSTGLVDFFLNQRIVRKTLVSSAIGKDGQGKPTTSYSVCFSSTVGARAAPTVHGPTANGVRQVRHNSFASSPRRPPSSAFVTAYEATETSEKNESHLSR